MRKCSYPDKICSIETRPKKGYDLQGYFLKMTRETISVLTIAVIHYFSSWTSFRSSCLEVFCKKGVLKISQNIQQKTCACGLQLYLKRDSVTDVWISWNFVTVCWTAIKLKFLVSKKCKILEQGISVQTPVTVVLKWWWSACKIPTKSPTRASYMVCH